jgi:hypothetical protein
VTKKQEARARAAKVEQMRREQERAERRRSAVVVAAALVVVVALVGAVTFVILRSEGERARLEAEANAPIEGIEEFEDLTANHVQTPVEYEQDPPVGGDHAQVWTSCSVYPAPVSKEESVHSLEHGAVWITYRPDLPSDQVAALSELAQGEDYALVSPYEGLDSPVVASAWGVQLAVDDASDPRLGRFLTQYLQGEQAPETGAACFRG